MEHGNDQQASVLFHQGRYQEALRLYTLAYNDLGERADTRIKVNILFNRSACHLKLKDFNKVLEDCTLVLDLEPANPKALSRKTKVLCSLGRFNDAYDLVQLWQKRDPLNDQAQRERQRLEIIVRALNDQDPDVGLELPPMVIQERVPPEGQEDTGEVVSPQPVAMTAGPIATSVLAPNNSPPSTHKYPPGAKSKPAPSNSQQQSNQQKPTPPGGHQENNVMQKVDAVSTNKRNQSKGLDGTVRDWKHRPPPRGLTNKEYTKCPRYNTEGGCRFGEQCSFAHSSEELDEWCTRFELRKLELKRLCEDGDSSSFTYAEKLTEKWMNAENPQTVMNEDLEGVNVHLNSEQNIHMSSKKSSHSWMLTLTTRVSLQRAILLDDANRKHFHISSITVGPKKQQKSQSVPTNCQEWVNPNFAHGKAQNEKVYRIKVVFSTDIFGTFRQSAVFDFGDEPVLVRHLCVDSTPVIDLQKLSETLIISEGGRWDLTKIKIIQFDTSCSPLIKPADETELMERYPAPIATKFTFSQTLLEPNLSRPSYIERMHSLLNLEEMAQFSCIAKFNVKTSLQLVDRFLLMPSSSHTTAKYAPKGELYARMKLNGDISEDTAHGRLILQNVNAVYLAPIAETVTPAQHEVTPEKVYETFVEEKGKNFIFIRLPSECVTENNLKMDTEFTAQVQFHLNRLPICQMHMGVDRLRNLDLLFPEVEVSSSIPWTPQKLWRDKLDNRLNPKQKEAIVAITTDTTVKLPPILIIGPYGTGKTFTLAQATKDILCQENTRVLICTHSNSAADLYIKDYLHPYVEDGHPEATPLRMYYRHRWVQTVHPIVLQYCLQGSAGDNGMSRQVSSFRHPTLEDLKQVRVVVTTLSTSQYMYQQDMPPDFFTHILLDEAAQALECESILPLAMAGPKTRVVLAGDHMQLSPEIHSEFAQDRDFQKSLLERLYDVYPDEHPCKILLCENYRSHKAIIDFTSELFYENKLVASGNQSRHDTFFPLTFFTARGEEVQHQNSTTFYNSAEVYETVERVSELIKTWPKMWGERGEASIGVVSPYSDQVAHIRAELRKRRLFNISVERVLNVQGKQFRAIILSTVRTRHTCSTDTSLEDVMDYGFLSNAKLLNTAITRAQSLVAVVGDPVALCSVGKCRKVWERFLEMCKEHNSLCGMTWDHLWAQIDGVELKKSYILNPLAPEFIPNRLRHGTVAPPEPFAYGKYGYMFNVRPHPRGYQGTYSGAGVPWRPTNPRPALMPPNGPNQMFQKVRLMPNAVNQLPVRGIRFTGSGPPGAVPRNLSPVTIKIPGSPSDTINSHQRTGATQHSPAINSSSPNIKPPNEPKTTTSKTIEGFPLGKPVFSNPGNALSPGATMHPTSQSSGSPLGRGYALGNHSPVFLTRPSRPLVDMRQYGPPQTHHPSMVRLGPYYPPQPVHMAPPGVMTMPPPWSVPHAVMAPYQAVSGAPPVMYSSPANPGIPLHGSPPEPGLAGGPPTRPRMMTSYSGNIFTEPSPVSSNHLTKGYHRSFPDSDAQNQLLSDVRNSLSPNRNAQKTRNCNSSGLESLIASKGSTFFKSLWLQQELYSYMVQTDGKEAANKFMQQMQAMATGEAPMIGEQHLASSPANLDDSSIIAVSKKSYKVNSNQRPDFPDAPADPVQAYPRNAEGFSPQGYDFRSGKSSARPEMLLTQPPQPTASQTYVSRATRHVVPPQLPPFTGPYSLQKKLAARNKTSVGEDSTVKNGPSSSSSQSTEVHQPPSNGESEGSADKRDALTETHLVADSVVKFLEDSLDESLSSSQLSGWGSEDVALSKLPLYMRGHSATQDSTTTTSSSTGSSRPMTYAGALRKAPPPGETTPVSALTTPPQPSLTHDAHGVLAPPRGHSAINGTQQLYPGGGIGGSGHGNTATNPDPLELLKNLNIKASPSTQALFDYFA